MPFGYSGQVPGRHRRLRSTTGPNHGYAFIRDIEAFASARMGAGTFAAIAKLAEAGLIEALLAEDRRHPYQMASIEVALLQQRLPEFERAAKVGLTRLAGSAL